MSPAPAELPLIGCDFSSAPSRRKPIVLARGALADGGAAVRLTGFDTFTTLDGFGAWLAAPGRWIGGFDLPFGLPRELIEALGWPTRWPAWLAHYRALSRAEIRLRFAAFCAARPVGGKFAHRVTDGPAGSSPSMKWVNPPVAFMLHAGVPLLVDAGAHLPGLIDGDANRVALEAYPGLTAREVLGRRSYKADDRARQTPERTAARAELLAALRTGATTAGQPLHTGLRLLAHDDRHDLLVADATGDHLDAVLCLLEAGAAARAHAAGHALYGLPAGLDPLEGWITGARPHILPR